MSMSDFQDYLYNNFSVDNNTPVFECRVTYKSCHGTVSASTRARMLTDTLGWGKISLTEVKELPAEEYHLDFDPNWQQMNFSAAYSSLVVEGNSEKMGGDYSVVIIPTGPVM